MPVDKKLGYTQLSMDDAKDKAKQEFIKNFGSDIDLDDGSNAGALANILASVVFDIDSLGAGIRDSTFLLKSSGQTLDDIGADEGVFRKAATPATTDLLITAYINDDAPFTVDPDNGEFSTANGQVFRIDDTATVTTQATDSNNQPMVDEDGNALGHVVISATSEDAGASQNVAPGAVVNPEESVDGFYSVTNVTKALGGLDVETDDKFRQRIYDNRQSKMRGSNDGLTTALRNISDVKDARVVSNREMTVDSYGNPPKSTHAYVLGGQPNEIAQTLYDTGVLDTKWVGKSTGTATSIDGRTYQIAYDNAPQALVYVKVNVKVDTTAFNTEYGVGQIKDAINSYFDSLSMGNDVNFTKLFSPIYSVAGVQDVQISMGRDSKDNIKPNQSININEMEVPVVADIDVEVG